MFMNPRLQSCDDNVWQKTLHNSYMFMQNKRMALGVAK